jgi:bifunctional non-homologous end joining protein LigD
MRAVTKAPLSAYRVKRDFATTPEPRGHSRGAPAAHLHFVIHKHASRRLHFDLRLELDGVFKSWAVPRGPSLNPRDKRLAVQVEDHPLEYGDFEGIIPKGQYGAGAVQIWDRGAWAPVGPTAPEAALKQGELTFALRGRRLKGGFALVRMDGARGSAGAPSWLLIKRNDPHARANGEAVLREDRSIASGRTMAAIAAGRGPAARPFMTRRRPADRVRSARAAPASRR